jgi:hypothetical protein
MLSHRKRSGTVPVSEGHHTDTDGPRPSCSSQTRLRVPTVGGDVENGLGPRSHPVRGVSVPICTEGQLGVDPPLCVCVCVCVCV